MSGINVPAELIKPLELLAAERGESVGAIVEQLIANFLREQRHHYLLAEMERFQAIHPELREQYEGQFVAMRDGRVLAHDSDGGRLYERMRQQYGDLPILIVEVTEQPEQQFVSLNRQLAQ